MRSTALAFLAAAALTAAPALLGAAEFALPEPGDYSVHDVDISVVTRSGSESRTLAGKVEARAYCLARDAEGTHFIVTFAPAAKSNGSGNGGEGIKGSVAYLVFDPSGRILPDVGKAGTKVSLDPTSWSGTGLIPRIPAELLENPGRKVEDIDLLVYGEAQKMPMVQSLTRQGEGLVFDRRPAQANLKMRIGRQAQPILRDYFDHWTMNANGAVDAWRHRTSLYYELPGKPALDVTVDMSAKLKDVGRLPEGELDALRKDASWLKPVWAHVVNPEPGELSKLDTAKLAGSVDDFLKTRADSKLAGTAGVLKEGFKDLDVLTAAAKEEDAKVGEMLNRPAPDFALKDMTGRTVKLSDYRGRPVMLVFWGLGCRLCKTEAPHLSELYEKYKDRGLVILAVESFDTDPADVAGYLRENKLRHPVLTGGAQVSSRTYNIGGLPRAFWIDKRGNVVGRQVGFDSKEALERKAEELLAQP